MPNTGGLSMADQLDRDARLWLALADAGNVRVRDRILERFGSYARAFEQFPAGFSDVVSARMQEELEKLKALGAPRLRQRLTDLAITVALCGDEESYPALLTAIPAPPDVLFYQGKLFAQEEKAVAIIGSRRETRYGRQQAFSIARDLARQGVTIVSGLARGIDTAAHKGALEGGGRTIAVLGSGLSRMYPEENRELAAQIIVSGGAVITELPPTAEPLAYRFPIRNRIVSGLCQALLVVEAREKSGTLITVNHALEQGREVFALPGAVDAPGSAVPHRMIRDGATMCTCAADLLEDMGWMAPASRAVAQTSIFELTEDPLQQKILESLAVEARDSEELLEETGLDMAELNIQLTLLEMEGLIEVLPGRLFRRKPAAQR